MVLKSKVQKQVMWQLYANNTLNFKVAGTVQALSSKDTQF